MRNLSYCSVDAREVVSRSIVSRMKNCSRQSESLDLHKPTVKKKNGTWVIA